LESAQLVIAKEYGFPNWEHVLSQRNVFFNQAFELLIDKILQGDITYVEEALKTNKALLNERSVYGHKATLLHYVGSNGIEIRRQIVPMNLPQITQLLIESGADLSTTAFLYNGKYTAKQLASSSIHPKRAGIYDELMKVFLQYNDGV